jgi:hypothetical protein
VRNPFEGYPGSGWCWEREVGGGGFGRNNNDEGFQEQGEGGTLEVWWRPRGEGAL